MQQDDLKQKAIKGMFWSLCERFGSLAILFVANVVLARKLSPDDFGLVGMMMVFIMLSQILVDGGFGNALIQRKNVTGKDCSTVFFSNIAIAVACYAILYCSASAIAGFYGQLQLKPLIRVLGLVIVLDAFGAVQNNLLMKELNFRVITVIKVGSALISTVVAITSVFCGLGVWSLVVQYIVNSFIKSLLLWITAKWYPKFEFSVSSFKEMFGFGSKLLIASLLSQGYHHLQVLIIGKSFPVKEVGYYTQAKQLETVPVAAVLTIVNQVTFPVFSQLQDDVKNLVKGLRRSLKVITMINFPVMFCLVVVAEPLFLMLFGEKWLPAVPYFRWLCGGYGALLVIHNTNMNSLKAIGKSDVVLYLEIAKKAFGLGVVFTFLGLGFDAMSVMWALTISTVTEFFLNGYFVGKYIGYGIFGQLKDILPNLVIAGVAGGIAYFVSTVTDMHYVPLIIVQIVCFWAVYLLVMKVCKIEAFEYIVSEIKTRKKIARR